MIVCVYVGSGDRRYVQVKHDDPSEKDTIRRIAFRFVHRRRELDYNELVHNTHIIDVEPVSAEVAAVMMSHVN